MPPPRGPAPGVAPGAAGPGMPPPGAAPLPTTPPPPPASAGPQLGTEGPPHHCGAACRARTIAARTATPATTSRLGIGVVGVTLRAAAARMQRQ
ncbi:MAG: hypothetical protein FJ301_03930 [Planctomycetes bacterium]|nr:hypothetical protein [Planctomycetota bacterium]